MWLPTNCMLEFLCSPPLPRSVMWAHRADSSPPLHNSSPRHHTKPQSPLSTSLATGLASRVVMGITVASHGVQRSAQSFKPLSLCSPCNVLACTPSTQSLPLKHSRRTVSVHKKRHLNWITSGSYFIIYSRNQEYHWIQKRGTLFPFNKSSCWSVSLKCDKTSKYCTVQKKCS